MNGRRSIVLLTDGVDSFENGGFERALSAIHRARATVYVVDHAAALVRDLKPRVFGPLAFWEMLDPHVRKKYQYLRQYVRELEGGETTLRGRDGRRVLESGTANCLRKRAAATRWLWKTARPGCTS